MVAVGDVLGKFSSLKATEKELSRLGFSKSKAVLVTPLLNDRVLIQVGVPA